MVNPVVVDPVYKLTKCVSFPKVLRFEKHHHKEFRVIDTQMASNMA